MITSLALAILSTPAMGGALTAIGSPNVRLVSENVQISLMKGVAKVEARYVFKTLGDVPIETKAFVPFASYNGGSITLPPMTATWDKAPLTLDPVGSKYQMTLRLRKAATHVARFSYSVSYPTSDGSGQFGYVTSGCASWKGPVERADYVLKYGEQSVYDIIGFEGDLGRWQWSTSGAYLQRSQFRPHQGEKWMFNFFVPER